MSTMASQITSFTIVCPTVYSVADQKKYQAPVTGEFPTQNASDAENVFIWWRPHILNASRGLDHLVASCVWYLSLLPRCLQVVCLSCKLFANLFWLTLTRSRVMQSQIRAWLLVPTVKIDCQISVGYPTKVIYRQKDHAKSEWEIDRKRAREVVGWGLGWGGCEGEGGMKYCPNSQEQEWVFIYPYVCTCVIHIAWAGTQGTDKHILVLCPYMDAPKITNAFVKRGVI